MPGGTVERQFTDRRHGTGFGRVAQNGKSSTCVVACVEVRASSPNRSRQLDPEILRRIALQRVERCLRPDDLVCAIGGGRLFVCFGPDANRAADGELGVRLASAVGRPLAVDRRRQDVDVVVGIGTGRVAGVSEVVGAALSASSALSSRMRASSQTAASSTARVVVAHVPVRNGHKRLQRREVFLTGPAHTNGSCRHGAPLSSVDVPGPAWGCALNVLLVSSDPLSTGRSNPAVDGLVASLRSIGVSPQRAASPDPEAVIDSYKRQAPEVVILALRSEAMTTNGSRAGATAWEQWARLTRELVRSGATVMAVSIGASVAAVATCVREGALGVLDGSELPEQLEKLGANLGSRQLTLENGAKDAGRWSGRAALPDPYHRLTYLTTSEHRVLFHMMRGASASEIAEDLIVSLATVRSHIRSILRKLRVRSQLAAVALANGAQPVMLDSD
jgi:DNA-binding NarL/FixJ family response regulator